ncbi:Transglutaminase-like enzyme, putative cysteine protease [Hymenobacter daecheongensis DSM 21074]|uniref:Transglutaminase-like enzyme, putative cysteine protease n=1 Tax=Hymenobacter daecheongensis DSM 21074 TaxID=1121955 RepID=A0A1M6AL20_9BACT|nr:transglutaminase domain-containing protein [Hymenobacter daecheongensis]SHI37204.1 Transglutaminase-like enzyme, putative cysteine protease [Hymenobacter daecheongensis DSM 21074]
MLFPALLWPLLLAFAAGPPAPADKPAAPAPLRSRTFSFDYTARLHDLPAGTKQLDLWLPVPHSDKSQHIAAVQVTAPYPYEILTGQYGNKVLHLRVQNPPAAGFAVHMAVQAVRREHRNPMLGAAPAKKAPKEAPDPNLQRWLQPDNLGPLDPKIRLWAQEVAANANAQTELEKAQAIYNHVVSTVKYDKSGQGWGRGDIYYACDARQGNCTDFHAVFIGYCRALGIPARFSIGFPLPPERGSGEVKGYHCWAEFFTKQTGWVPVDASEAAKAPARRAYFFGAHDENRLEFSRGRDLTLTPQQQGAALNYFIYPYAEADGQPFTGIDKQFTYKDLPATGK